ncbi:MAG: hypothetical protein AB1486_27775, partial [Planctomycetota bacterium]
RTILRSRSRCRRVARRRFALVNMRPGYRAASSLSSYFRLRTLGAGDGEQVGSFELAGSDHAALWTNGPTTLIDLHPTNATASSATDVGGGLQVGQVTINGATHATLWSGSGDSQVDLHGFLAAGFTVSVATDVQVDVQGVIRVTGYGYDAASGRTQPLIWWQGRHQEFSVRRMR